MCKEACVPSGATPMAKILGICWSGFERLEEFYPKAAQCQYRLRDLLMLALSMFVFKYPSLYQFLHDINREAEGHLSPAAAAQRQRAWANIARLFGVAIQPQDVTLRRRLDEVKTIHLAVIFRLLGQWLQQQPLWSDFQTPQGNVLLALDGTGIFSSSKVHCQRCGVKHHREGKKTYYHQMVAVAAVHPRQSVALPLEAEAVSYVAGSRQQDGELAAAKRLLPRLREAYPQTPFCVLGDALYSTGPMVQLLLSLAMDFMLVVKPGQGTRPRLYRYEAVAGYEEARWLRPSRLEASKERAKRDRGTLRYRILRARSLNATHPDLKVTVIQGERVRNRQVQVVGEWVTNLSVTPANVAALVRDARQRWQIENEVFQTMKDQKGLNFEHNFGHGKAHLCDNLGMLMFLAALADQLSYLTCPLFREVRGLSTTWARLWERQRIYLCDRSVSGWTGFYTVMLGGLDPHVSS